MKEDIRGFVITNLNEGKPVKIEMNDEQRKKFEESSRKVVQPEVYLIEFIGKENFDRVEIAMDKALDKSLPKGLKENCKWCLGESEDESDKACKKYELQAFITFKLMAVEFVNVIRSNPYVFNDKKLRFKLTEEFFRSLVYYNGRGLMAVNMGRLMEKVLEMGLLSINQKLLQTKELSKNLKIINHSLHALNNDSLPYKIKGGEIPEFITIQLDFFKKQRKFYKEEQRLKREQIIEKAQSLNSNSNGDRPNRSDIAYFCYYTSETRELITQNPFPSKKAWEELGKLFSKSPDNIEKKYNEIFKSKTERLKSGRYKVIEYVIQNMLDDYPKAKKLALEELKLAKIN